MRALTIIVADDDSDIRSNLDETLTSALRSTRIPALAKCAEANREGADGPRQRGEAR